MDVLLKILCLYVPGEYILAYTVIRLLSLAIPPGRILVFAGIHGTIVAVVRDILGMLGPHVGILMITYVLLAIFILKIPLATALMIRIIGACLTVAGELVVVKILSNMSVDFNEVIRAVDTHIIVGWLGQSAVLLTAVYVCCIKPAWKKLRESQGKYNSLKQETILLIIGLLIVAVLFMGSSWVLATRHRDLEAVSEVMLYTCLFIFSGIGLLSYRYLQTVKIQNQQLHMQQEIIAMLREQRHDILNELTLALAYIQTGKLDKARQCIMFVAADLSDRYNPATLPDDAWFTVIQTKQKQACELGVRFETKLQANEPQTPRERRLLPKMLFNLLDNALEAAQHSNTPMVELEWKNAGNSRLLIVRNNGPEIPDDVKEAIFEKGYSTKGENRGWGLAICQKIASELGGRLSMKSCEQYTEFTLELPLLTRTKENYRSPGVYSCNACS